MTRRPPIYTLSDHLFPYATLFGAGAAGGAAERKIAAEFDAGHEDVVEAETVSGDANVAAIEDAPQDEPDNAPAAEDRAEGEPLAAAAEIGRETRREREGQYVSIRVDDESVTKKRLMK